MDREAPLPAAVRARMEPGFGADFSGVRVHTGPLAAQLCRALGARAFAYGARVFYGEGLGPGVDEVTAHELAHVVQQRGQPSVVAPLIELWSWEGDDLTPARKKAFDSGGNDLTERIKATWPTPSSSSGLRCPRSPPSSSSSAAAPPRRRASRST